MSVEAGLVAILKADETVAGLVTARIYPVYIPESATLPCITYQVTGKTDVNCAGGQTPLVEGSAQITCFATTYLGAVALADAVRSAVGGYSGTAGGTVIQAIFVTDQGDIPEVSPDDDVSRRFARRINIDVWHLV